MFKKDKQYIQFCAYGFLKNLRFYDVFLLLFFLENGLSYSQIGMLYAAREIIINIAEVPSGIIADTYGRKSSLLIALLTYLASFFVFYISTDFFLLLIAILLNGVGDAFRSGTHKGMIIDYLRQHQWEKHKVEYYGHTRSWSQRGSAISALFAGFFVFYSGSYRLVYLLAVIPYLLNLVNIYTYPDELNHSMVGKTKYKSLRSVFKSFIDSIRAPGVFQIINSTALHSSFLKALKDYIQPVMVQIAILLPIMATLDIKKKSGLVIGTIYFIIFLLNAYASKSLAKAFMLKYKNIVHLSLLSGLVAGAFCGLFILLEFWVAALVVFLLIYFIENIRKPILVGSLSDNVPNEILTSVISAQSFYGTLLTSVLAVLLGLMADVFGIGAAIFTISGMLILLVFFMIKIKSGGKINIDNKLF